MVRERLESDVCNNGFQFVSLHCLIALVSVKTFSVTYNHTLFYVVTHQIRYQATC